MAETEPAVDLDRAYNELREINSDIAALSGRLQGNRSALAMALSKLQRAVFREKKSRPEELGHRRFVPLSGPAAPLPRRSIQSSVVLPIETKSREETLTKLKQSEKKEDTVRFQKDSKSVAPKADVQVQKQREVEKRLEANKKEEQEKVNKQKGELLAKRREKEVEIQRLQRQNAIKKNLEEKEVHFQRLQQFIQSQTKPPIFYLPAKHTLRSLELQKESAKNMDCELKDCFNDLFAVLIEKCRERAERELKDNENEELDIINRSVASKVAVSNGKGVEQEVEQGSNSSKSVSDEEK